MGWFPPQDLIYESSLWHWDHVAYRILLSITRKYQIIYEKMGYREENEDAGSLVFKDIADSWK